MNIAGSCSSESSTTSNSFRDELVVEGEVEKRRAGADGSMSTEIEAAVTFLTDVMRQARFDDEAVDHFRTALVALLRQHYAGHWYPNDPFKGSGYRCLRVNGVMNPLLTKAAQLSGLPIKKFRLAFPVELTVWVDPGDVSVRFGEEGSIGVYYARAGVGLRHDHQEMEALKSLVALAKRAATPPASFGGRDLAATSLAASRSSRNSPVAAAATSCGPQHTSQMDSRAAASMYNSTSALLRQQSPAARRFCGAPSHPMRRTSPPVEPADAVLFGFASPDLSRADLEQLVDADLQAEQFAPQRRLFEPSIASWSAFDSAPHQQHPFYFGGAAWGPQPPVPQPTHASSSSSSSPRFGLGGRLRGEPVPVAN